MTPRLVACTKCRAPLPPVLYNLPELRPCPACNARAQVDVFPAALRPPGPSSLGEAVMGERSGTPQSTFGGEIQLDELVRLPVP